MQITPRYYTFVDPITQVATKGVGWDVQRVGKSENIIFKRPEEVAPTDVVDVNVRIPDLANKQGATVAVVRERSAPIVEYSIRPKLKVKVELREVSREEYEAVDTTGESLTVKLLRKKQEDQLQLLQEDLILASK